MARLDSLEVELLALIFEYVADSSSNSALNFALTSKIFYTSGKLVAHRYKTISLNHDGTSEELQGWLQNEDVLRGLRHLEVRNARRTDSKVVSCPDLVTLIEKLSNLKTLTWSDTNMIPSQVLEALDKHQKTAKLGIFNFERADQVADANDPHEIALAHSPALTAIRTRIWANGVFPDLRRACFERIVANAPNLKFASISQGASGCVVHAFTVEQVEEQAKLAEKFHTHKRPNSSLRRLTLDGFGLDEDTLRYWARFIDLSQLESIKFSRGFPDASYFRYAPQVLTNIKHLSLNLYGREDLSAEVENHLTTCSPLKSISLWSWRKTIGLTTILACHGPTLETLQLHERETTGGFNDQERRQVLGIEEIKAIREACPKLKDLTIDCDRHTEGLDTEIESDEVLKEISEMKLSKLQIYYDLGLEYLADTSYNQLRRELDRAANQPLPDDEDDDLGQASDDTLDGEGDQGEDAPIEQPKHLAPSTKKQIRPFVSKLWRFIFGSRTHTPIRILELKFGEWERKLGVGYPARWLIDESEIKTRWLAKPHERDDRSDTCVVESSGRSFPEHTDSHEDEYAEGDESDEGTDGD